MVEALKERRLMKKLAAINRENVPERALFAKGAGARGFFQPYMTMTDYTAADFLSDPEKQTSVFVRFSKGLEGGGETGRDIRGFAVKFYTDEGNYDLVSSSMPVFYTGDPRKLPALIRALKRERESNLKRPEHFFRFVAENPEALTLLLNLYGDGGTVKSYRHMPGYGVNTYLWSNAAGQRFLARCSWLPLAGARRITRQEGEFLAGFDPDAASRDLYETLKEGQSVEYELTVQLVPKEKEAVFSFSLTDASRCWPQSQIPVIRVGKLILTDVVSDYLNEVEKAAFSPGNLVRGIAFSGDPLLPAMTFAMEDSHRHRLGAGYEELEVNRSRLEDKDEDTDENQDEEWETANRTEGLSRFGTRGSRYAEEGPFSQAADYYKSLCNEEKQTLRDNLLEDMTFLPELIQKELLHHFMRIDVEFGKEIAKELVF